MSIFFNFTFKLKNKMNLHEYQGKSLLAGFGVTVPIGYLASTIEEAIEKAKLIKEETHCEKWAVKAQIHAGGRGKGGGVKIAGSIQEVESAATQILGMQLITPQTPADGKKVRKIYVEQGIYYKGEYEINEFYICILFNRKSSHNNIIYSPRGGMDIEKVAEETPELIFTEEIDSVVGLQPYQCRKIAFNLGLSGNAFKAMIKFIDALYIAYQSCDTTLLEINPIVKTADEKIYAADVKISIDSNALYRHPVIAAMRDTDEEDPYEVEAGKEQLNYIRLDGNVGCMVNGAGLAMATMDIIKLSGGSPANFLDVGGSADADRIEKGFRIILKDSNVKAILINIFGGIVRCDRVANGVVAACKNIGNISVPIIVRLQGTNAVEAKKIIEQSGLKFLSATELQDAANLISKIIL